MIHWWLEYAHSLKKKNAMICSYKISYSIEHLLLFEGYFIGFIIEGLYEFSKRDFHSLSHFRYAVGVVHILLSSMRFVWVMVRG